MLLNGETSSHSATTLSPDGDSKRREFFWPKLHLLMPIHIGNKVQQLYKENTGKITTEELADKLSVSRQHIYRLMERSNWDSGLIVNACKFFRFDLFLFLSQELRKLYPNIKFRNVDNGELDKLKAENESLKKDNKFLAEINQLQKDRLNGK